MSAPAHGLLTPGEVAELLRVDPKTVARWAQAGMLASVRTPGGHRRFSQLQVMSLRGAVAENEIGLSLTDVSVICESLAKGPDEHGRKDRIGKVLAGLEAGALIRVTG